MSPISAMSTASTPGVALGSTSIVADEDTILRYEERIKELERENAELKRKQVEITAAKELYLKIFEDFPALIWRSRLDKLCDYFNRTWLEWTGKTMEQEFGNGWANGVHPDDFDQCLETYIKAFDNREHFYMEYRLIDKYGNYRWIGDHGTPFYDLDDTFLGYIGSCYDITEIKINEQKLRKLNATKDKFFSIVAHDLRNPISAFVSVSELLMESQDLDSQEMAEIAGMMHKDAKNTLLLLENLLEWSKAQADEISFAPSNVQLQELCEQVVAQVNLCAKGKQISVTCQVPNCTLWADKNMLTTILRNLLMNSVKFTKHGGLITLKATMVVAPEDLPTGNKDNKNQACCCCLITVQDNGVGISSEQIEGLFNLVKKAGQQSHLGTDNEAGSGLGLVICKDFVEKHGGTIWAESELGQGTEFKFTIPIVEEPTIPTTTTTTEEEPMKE